MTAAARRGYVNFFVEYGGKTKRCRVTEAALLNKARVSKEDTSSALLITTLREALPTASRQHPGESLLWISSADGRSSIFASLTLTSSFAMRMRVEWAGVGEDGFAGRGMIVGSDGNDGDLMLSLTNIMTIRQQRCLEGASRPRHVLA